MFDCAYNSVYQSVEFITIIVICVLLFCNFQCVSLYLYANDNMHVCIIVSCNLDVSSSGQNVLYRFLFVIVHIQIRVQRSSILFSYKKKKLNFNLQKAKIEMIFEREKKKHFSDMYSIWIWFTRISVLELHDLCYRIISINFFFCFFACLSFENMLGGHLFVHEYVCVWNGFF